MLNDKMYNKLELDIYFTIRRKSIKIGSKLQVRLKIWSLRRVSGNFENDSLDIAIDIASEYYAKIIKCAINSS